MRKFLGLHLTTFCSLIAFLVVRYLYEIFSLPGTRFVEKTLIFNSLRVILTIIFPYTKKLTLWVPVYGIFS